MRRIEAIVQMSEQGVTHPFRCMAEDHEWWCKGWHTGVCSLVREWVCACLARGLGLPIPDFAIMEVPLEMFDGWASFQDKPQCLVLPGQPFVFASRNVPRCVDVEALDSLKEMSEELREQIFLFDHAIRNLDRSDGNSNLLLAEKDGQTAFFYVIDHNNAFDGAFSEEAFREAHIMRPLIKMTEEKAVVFRERVRRWVETSLEACWSEMPDEWRAYENLDLHLEAVRKCLTAKDVTWAEAI